MRGGLEKLRVDTGVEKGICGACRMKPRAEALDLTLSDKDGVYDVTICRDCLAEHVPHLLEIIEGDS